MDKPYETRERQDGSVKYAIEFWYEYDPDTSYWGEYSNKWEPHAIDRFQENYGRWRHSREYRYFIPDCTPTEVADSYAYFYACGESKHQAWVKATRIPLRQYHAMEALNAGDWHYLGICVKAYIGSEEIAADSLFGIESSWNDKEWGWGEQDYNDIIDDMISECKSQFLDTLKHLETTAKVLKEII